MSFTHNEIKSAESKIESIFTEWFVDDPVMLGAWCVVDKVVDKTQETMGIDSRTNPPVIRYNPNFVNILSKDVLEAVMASEGFKLLLKHPTTRLKEPRSVSSMASQITINQSILNGNSKYKNEKYMIKPETFSYENDKWFEYYFSKLMDDLDDVMSKMNLIFGGSEDSGDSDKKESEGEDAGTKTFNSESDALKEYMNPEGTSNMNWAINDLLDAEINNMVNEKKGSAKDWGKFTGDAMGDIVAANTPKISYKDIIRRFNVSVLSSHSVTSRMKVNRRYDLEQPGKKRTYNSKIIFAVDVSGSMSVDDLREGFSVINSVCRHSEIEYVLFDTEIKQIEKKMKRAKKTFKVTGRGGTDFQAVVDYASTTRSDGLVIYTDGYAPAPTKPKNTKVLWLMSKTDQKPPVDWGMTAVLDRFESH